MILEYRVLHYLNESVFKKNLPDLQTDLNLTDNYKCVLPKCDVQNLRIQYLN